MKNVDFTKKLILYIICFLIFFRFIFDGMTYPLFNYIFALSTFFIFLLVTIINFKKINFDYTEIPLVLFFFFSILSSLFSEIKGTGVRYNSYIVSYLYLLIILKNILTEKNKKILINAILFSVFFITIYGIYQRFWGLEETRKFIFENQQALLYQYPDISKYISPTFLGRMESNRIFSTFVYPNIYAGFLISLMPFLFFLFIDEYKNLYGFFSLLLFFLCFFNLILTESVGGILIFIFVFHLIFLHITFGEKKIKKILPFLLSFEFIFLFIAYKLKILPHIHSFIDRIQYWKISLKIFPINPILGIGSENFKYYFLKYKLPQAMEAKHAHSLFFEILVENGLVGLFLLFIFLLSKIIKTLNSKKDKILTYGVFYLFLSFLLHNLIDFDFSDPAVAVIFFIFSAFIETQKNTLSVRLTKPLLCFIIIIGIYSNINLVKYENSERYRNYSEKEKNLNIKIYYLEKAENWFSKNFEVFLERGDLFLSIWQFTNDSKYLTNAVSDYKKALNLNPYLTRAYRRMAYLYEEIKDYQMAEKMYLKLIEIYPNKKLYNLDIARFYKKIGKNDKFEFYYEKSKNLIGMNIEEGILIDEIQKWIELQK